MTEKAYHYYEMLVENPDDAYNRLMTELDWCHAGATVPRKEYYVHDAGLPYTYGMGDFARTYESQPDHPVIACIREKLSEVLGVRFDIVFLNLYEHKLHHLGWHADDSPEMSDAHPIVTVSLGAEREIWFRPLSDIKNITKLKLQHGSACAMLPGVQDTHQHRIPKHDRECGPRISLTFRVYVDPQNNADD